MPAALNQRLDRLHLLAPFLQLPALRLIELCKDRLGRTLLVVSTFRTVQEQMLNWQQGRRYDRASGIWMIEDQTKLVTKAAPGTTPHNVLGQAGRPASLAVDVIPLDPETGNPDWTPGEDFWDALYELSWKVGLDPLGDVIGAYYQGDKGHFEEPGWKGKLDGLGLVLPAPVLTQQA